MINPTGVRASVVAPVNLSASTKETLNVAAEYIFCISRYKGYVKPLFVDWIAEATDELPGTIRGWFREEREKQRAAPRIQNPHPILDHTTQNGSRLTIIGKELVYKPAFSYNVEVILEQKFQNTGKQEYLKSVEKEKLARATNEPKEKIAVWLNWRRQIENSNGFFVFNLAPTPYLAVTLPLALQVPLVPLALPNANVAPPQTQQVGVAQSTTTPTPHAVPPVLAAAPSPPIVPSSLLPTAMMNPTALLSTPPTFCAIRATSAPPVTCSILSFVNEKTSQARDDNSAIDFDDSMGAALSTRAGDLRLVDSSIDDRRSISPIKEEGTVVSKEELEKLLKFMSEMVHFVPNLAFLCKEFKKKYGTKTKEFALLMRAHNYLKGPSEGTEDEEKLKDVLKEALWPTKKMDSRTPVPSAEIASLLEENKKLACENQELKANNEKLAETNRTQSLWLQVAEQNYYELRRLEEREKEFAKVERRLIRQRDFKKSQRAIKLLPRCHCFFISSVNYQLIPVLLTIFYP